MSWSMPYCGGITLTAPLADTVWNTARNQRERPPAREERGRCLFQVSYAEPVEGSDAAMEVSARRTSTSRTGRLPAATLDQTVAFAIRTANSMGVFLGIRLKSRFVVSFAARRGGTHLAETPVPSQPGERSGEGHQAPVT